MRHTALLLLVSLLLPLSLAARTPIEAAARSIGEVRAGYHDPDSLCGLMAARPLTPVEGLWELAGHGSLVAVELMSASPEIYSITLVRAADLGLLPGTLVGCLTPMAEAGAYDARLASTLNPSPGTLPRHSTYTVRFSADRAYLRLEPYGDTVKLNWWRMLLPYRWRLPLVRNQKSRPDVSGFRRVYPAPDPPLTPRYL